MKTKKLIVFFLVLLAIVSIVSIYVSGAIVLYLADQKITFSSLKYSIFFEVVSQYKGVAGYTKYVVGAWIGFAIPYIVWVAFVILILVGLKEKKSIHGNARLASDMDLSKSSFFPDPNVKTKYPPILIGKMFKGKYKNKFIEYCGQQFLMLYAPTRSGKGVGIVIPNCLNYPESIVVLDIKLENFIFSAGYREKVLKQKIYLFSPDGYADGEDFKNRKVRSSRFNPLSYISRDPLSKMSDLNRVSSILFPKSGGENDMWTDLSANLFSALVLYLIDLEGEEELITEFEYDKKGRKIIARNEDGFVIQKDKMDEDGNPVYKLDKNGNRIIKLGTKGESLYEEGKYILKNGKNEKMPLYEREKENVYKMKVVGHKPKHKVTLSEVLKISVPRDGSSLGDFLAKEVERRNSIENKKAWNEFLKNGGNKPELNLLSDNTVSLIYQFSNKDTKQQGSIMFTFEAELKVFSNPITAAATDANDFDLREVRKQKMSIYFGLSPDSLPVYAKLTNLFFSLLVGENVGQGKLPDQDPTLKYQCLLVLDEFTSMGRVEIIQKSIAFTAGYNIRFLFILQNKGQLEDDKTGYGVAGAKTFIENCAVELVYPPRFVNEQVETVSESIGYYDMKIKNVSKSSGGGGGSSTSTSFNVEKRAVLLPQEIVELRDIKHKSGVSTREIVMSEFCRPFIADKIIYFDEPWFIERKIFAEKNVPEIPHLDVTESDVEKALFEQRVRKENYVQPEEG